MHCYKCIHFIFTLQLMKKKTKTVMFKGLSPLHTHVVVYECERTVWYLFGIPVWFTESEPEIIMHINEN